MWVDQIEERKSKSRLFSCTAASDPQEDTTGPCLHSDCASFLACCYPTALSLSRSCLCTLFPYPHTVWDLKNVRITYNVVTSMLWVLDLFEHTVKEVSYTLENTSVRLIRSVFSYNHTSQIETWWAGNIFYLSFLYTQMYLREEGVLKHVSRDEPAFDACMPVMQCCSSTRLHCKNLQA